MFSATVSASNSEKCWNTMPMPSLRAAAGLAIVDRLALPAELARRRLQRAIDDLDQRRLAGAVLAQKRMDLAGLDPQGDIVIGLERAEDLDDAERLEQIGVALAVSPSRPRRLAISRRSCARRIGETPCGSQHARRAPGARPRSPRR